MNKKNKKIIKWNFTDWKEFSIGTFFGVLSATCGASLPFLVRFAQEIFNDKQDDSTIKPMLIIILIMMAIGLVAIFFSFFSKIFLSKLSSRKLAQIREEMFENIQNASIQDLKKYNHGSLLTRLTTDIYNFSLYYNWFIINVIPSFLRWLIFTIMVLMLNYIIGLILILLSFILYGVSYLLSRKSIKHFEVSLQKTDRINKIIQENIVGSRIIRAFNLRQRQIERFSKLNLEKETSSYKAETKAFSSWPFAIFFVNMSSVIVILVASQIGWLNVDWVGVKIDVGTIYAIFSYSYLILWSVYDFVFLYVYKARAIVPINRIYELKNLKNSLLNEQGQDFVNGDIELKNVSFKYNVESTDYVLKNINLKIPCDSKVGIIGSTGSGKTTLINLILRLYDPNEGSIEINKVDIKNIKTKSLLKNFSIAFQEKYFFSDSIRNNIKINNNEISDEEIYDLLEISQLKSFVSSKPEGLNYNLEESAQNLSGGQKQRLNIARALANTKASILILDSTTSALDNITEQKILDSIFKSNKNRTLMIFSQKISTIQNMDLIIVLDKGQIIGKGTHEELLKNNLTYQEIYKYQSKE